MSRYRLYPECEQAATLLAYCSDARYIWNLAWNLNQCSTLETYGKASRRTSRDGSEYIHQKRRPVRRLPGLAEQCRMLTEARAEHAWLGQGSVNVQQQALRDFDQALRNFYGGTHGYPQRRKKHLDEGFRITDFTFTAHVRRLNRRWGQVKVPKIGWVRFRWTRAVPPNGAAAKAGLNRAILAQGWGLLARRITDKAPGRVEKVKAAYTSLRCSNCGWIDKNSRESQAGFCCTRCGFTCNADMNAAANIAAGHAGGKSPSVRETSGKCRMSGTSGIPRLQAGEDVNSPYDTPAGRRG